MKMPLWLKILIVLVLISFPIAVLGAVSPFVIPVVAALVLMLFPGRDPERPTLARVLPWWWGFEALASLVFLVLQLAGKTILPGDERQPGPVEMLAGIILNPILIWALVKRHRSFKIILVIVSLIGLGMDFWTYSDSERDFKAIFELGGSVAFQVAITIYLLVKVRTQKRELAEQ